MFQGRFVWNCIEFENNQNLYLFLELSASNTANTKQTYKNKNRWCGWICCRNNMKAVTSFRRKKRSTWLNCKQQHAQEGVSYARETRHPQESSSSHHHMSQTHHHPRILGKVGTSGSSCCRCCPCKSCFKDWCLSQSRWDFFPMISSELNFCQSTQITFHFQEKLLFPPWPSKHTYIRSHSLSPVDSPGLWNSRARTC